MRAISSRRRARALTRQSHRVTRLSAPDPTLFQPVSSHTGHNCSDVFMAYCDCASAEQASQVPSSASLCRSPAFLWTAEENQPREFEFGGKKGKTVISRRPRFPSLTNSDHKLQIT